MKFTIKLCSKVTTDNVCIRKFRFKALIKLSEEIVANAHNTSSNPLFRTIFGRKTYKTHRVLLTLRCDYDVST